MMNYEICRTCFLTWRILLFIPMILGNILLPYRSGYEYTNIWIRTLPYFPIDNSLLYPWANFDGVHYLSFASFGYTTEGNFFPLYPLLINKLVQLFGGGQALGATYFFSGLIIANLCFLLFSLLSFIIPLSSGTFNGLPRYVVVLFPVFMALALIESQAIKISYTIISPILLFVLLIFFSRGYFVA